MLMNKLSRTDFFNLLIEKAKGEVTYKVMQNAYEEFIEQIRIVSNENDYSTTYRILVATRIEIASFETAPLYGLGEKCA